MKKRKHTPNANRQMSEEVGKVLFYTLLALAATAGIIGLISYIIEITQVPQP